MVDAELFRLDSVIRWLDAADGRIARVAAEPVTVEATPLPKLPGRWGRDDDARAATGFQGLRPRPIEVHALCSIDLAVDAGELVAVMGPSGSGKSTLLTIAGSLEEPSGGEVLVGGAPLSRMSRNDRARLRRRSIGFVFQDFNLLSGLTAAENVSLGVLS